MTFTQPYNGLPPILLIRRVLDYIANVLQSDVAFDYSGDDPFPAEDETAYNSITWNDVRSQPTWQNILDNYIAAWNYAYTHNSTGIVQDDLQQKRLDYLDSYVEGVLEPNSLVKADWSASSGLAQILNKPTVPSTLDQLSDGTTNKAYTATEKTKLSGIAGSATANSSDATLLGRANHTGTQSADTVTDGTTNKAYTATEKTKLAGIATAATANDTDANLKNRANHTGTQAESTVTNLTSDLANRPIVYSGSTQKAGAKFLSKSATVSSGTAIFYLTDDATVSGNALFTNVYLDSLNLYVSDATASYQMSHALTNSNKTLTVTVNKLTTANILTGVLGQAAANGATVRLTVWGD